MIWPAGEEPATIAPMPASSPLDWLPAALRAQSRVRKLAAGETLFRQGDETVGVFEVEQGQLRMIRHTLKDEPAVLHIAGPGELFAEAALFATAYHCDAVAAADSRVRVYPKRLMLAAFRRNPDLAERFMAILARQTQVLRARLHGRNIRSARERVLHHLALMTGPDGRTVSLRGTVKDLAGEIGLTHEALYRTLAALQRQDLIARTPTQITLRKRRRV
jgi:CRP-like cAMP-binding protein